MNTLSREGKGVSILQKPDKIFLENTNLSFALKESPDVGSIRETFAMNQLTNAGLDVVLPEIGDFLTSGLHIEKYHRSMSISKHHINLDLKSA